MKTITFSIEEMDVTVQLKQYASNGRFKVVYGLQESDKLTYSEACGQLGECLLHSLSCAGSIDNEVE